MRFWRHLHMIGLPPSLRGQTADTNPHAAWISRHVRILPNFSPWLPSASVSHILAVGLALGFFTCICTFIQGPHKILVLKTIRFPLKMMTSHSSLRLGEWQTDLFLTWPNTWRMIVSSKLKVCRKHEFVTCIDHLSLFTRATSSTFWKEIDHPLPQNWEYVIILLLSLPPLVSPHFSRVFFVVSSALTISLSLDQSIPCYLDSFHSLQHMEVFSNPSSYPNSLSF